jgi:hypothetical protein
MPTGPSTENTDLDELPNLEELDATHDNEDDS